MNTRQISKCFPRTRMLARWSEQAMTNACSRTARVFGVALALYVVMLPMADDVSAHHVLGRPAYSLNEDSNTPPSMQAELRIGDYFVTYMAFPAFPRPNEPGRVNLYITRTDNGEPFQGPVTFKVRDDVWFGSTEEQLGTQTADDSVFRQGFLFDHAGDYIVTAQFEPGGESHTIDFPLRIGEPSAVGPVKLAVGLLLIVLIGVNVLQRKRLLRARIRAAHRGETS